MAPNLVPPTCGGDSEEPNGAGLPREDRLFMRTQERSSMLVSVWPRLGKGSDNVTFASWMDLGEYSLAVMN